MVLLTPQGLLMVRGQPCARRAPWPCRVCAPHVTLWAYGAPGIALLAKHVSCKAPRKAEFKVS